MKSSPMPATASPVTVYEGQNAERASLSAWKAMVLELIAYRELIHRLLLRDVVSQFRQSFLSYAWIALPPIATTLVFSLLRQANIVNVPMENQALPYAIFVLVGSTIWGFFTQVSMMATGSISSAGALVSKIYFPREVLVLSATGQAVVNLVVRIAVVALAMALFRFVPHADALWVVPLMLLPALLLGAGIGLFMAPLNTMMHDVGRLMAFAFQFGMFMAPTVYPTPVLAAASSPWQVLLYWLHTVNPLTHFMHAINDALGHGSFVWDSGLSIAWVVSIVVFLAGWRFFHVCEPLLAERL